MSEADISAGLVLPYAAVALLGRGGAIGTLLIIFMAVTSATSSELIAVSSIFTYDFYRTYVKPDASGRRLIYMSHVIVVCYALFISTFSVGLYYAGISMGYLYLMMGVIISAAVIPATLTLIWSGQNKWAAALSPIFGLAFALVAWLVTAKKECGDLGVACTGSNNPMLAACWFAVIKAGGIAVSTMPLLRAKELKQHVFHFLDDSVQIQRCRHAFVLMADPQQLTRQLRHSSCRMRYGLQLVANRIALWN